MEAEGELNSFSNIFENTPHQSYFKHFKNLLILFNWAIKNTNGDSLIIIKL